MRRILTWLALVFCGGVSAAAVMRVVRTEWRGATTFDHADLETWLTATDSPTPPPSEVRRAAWHLEQDFAVQRDWFPFYKALVVDKQRTFQERWNLLLGELFLQRARQFATPMLEREAFLTAQLTTLQTWYAIDQRGRRVSGPALLMDVDRLSKSFDRADPAAKRNLIAFRDALGKFAADRMLRRFMPGEPEKAGDERADD